SLGTHVKIETYSMTPTVRPIYPFRTQKAKILPSAPHHVSTLKPGSFASAKRPLIESVTPFRSLHSTRRSDARVRPFHSLKPMNKLNSTALPIHITPHHLSLSPALADFVREKLAKVPRFASDV